jgi:hypothetical protein
MVVHPVVGRQWWDGDQPICYRGGDLLFIGCHPYLGDGDLGDLRGALRMLEASGADRFVPGHGPVCGVDGLRTLARYIDDVERLAAVSDGTPTIPDPYRSWGFARFFRANIEFCAGGGRQPEAPPR